MEPEKPSLADLIMALTDETTDASRPFCGQPQTNFGERGQQEVKGLRFRDLADAVARAWIDAAGHTVEDQGIEEELRRRTEDGTLNYNDLYRLDCGDIDPVALIQCISCRVEKAMGIFPNVPPLRWHDT